MFWADKIAQELKKRKLPLEWMDDMKTPSGRVHVGALCGVIVHDLVYKATKDAGHKARYTYVFENHDPMDDIPSYLPKEKYEKYLGMPLFKIPSPEPGYDSYADFYALEFKEVFNKLGCNPEIIWTKDLYTSGKMNPIIKDVLDKADIIRDIYSEMYKKELPVDWYPFQVYCPKCSKVSTTKVTGWDGHEVAFQCNVNQVKFTKGCGMGGKISPYSNENTLAGKMPWKIEWPSKWKAIGVTVEGGGKDHMSSGGSHDIAVQICKKVLDYPVPYPISYEWILIGGRKMSSSKGVGIAAKDILDILPPELARFLIVKKNINQQVNFDPSDTDTIPKLFDDYQKASSAYFDKTDEDLARVFELSQIGKIKKPPSLRFSVLAQWIQMPNMKDQIKKDGLEEWARYAKIWIEKYAPESEKFIVQKKLPFAARKLSLQQKEYLREASFILMKENQNAENLQKKLYDLSKKMDIPAKEAFRAIYTILIGKDHGPKAAWLILSLDKDFVVNRFRIA